MTIMVLCSIVLTAQVAGANIQMKTDVDGRVLDQNQKTYTVDFNEGVKRLNGVGDYSKVTVNRDSCMREN